MQFFIPIVCFVTSQFELRVPFRAYEISATGSNIFSVPIKSEKGFQEAKEEFSSEMQPETEFQHGHFVPE